MGEGWSCGTGQFSRGLGLSSLKIGSSLLINSAHCFQLYGRLRGYPLFIFGLNEYSTFIESRDLGLIKRRIEEFISSFDSNRFVFTGVLGPFAKDGDVSRLKVSGLC